MPDVTSGRSVEDEGETDVEEDEPCEEDEVEEEDEDHRGDKEVRQLLLDCIS